MSEEYERWRRRFDDAIVASVATWMVGASVDDGMVVCFDAMHAAWMAAEVVARVPGCVARGRTLRAGPRRVCMAVSPTIADTYRVSTWWRSPDAEIAPWVVQALHERGAEAQITESQVVGRG